MRDKMVMQSTPSGNNSEFYKQAKELITTIIEVPITELSISNIQMLEELEETKRIYHADFFEVFHYYKPYPFGEASQVCETLQRLGVPVTMVAVPDTVKGAGWMKSEVAPDMKIVKKFEHWEGNDERGETMNYKWELL